jgi:hypothetical protein
MIVARLSAPTPAGTHESSSWSEIEPCVQESRLPSSRTTSTGSARVATQTAIPVTADAASTPTVAITSGDLGCSRSCRT